MDNIIGLKELRQNVAKYAARVKLGQTFVVVKQSKPLFKLGPIDSQPRRPLDIEAWKKFAGILKGRKGPDALKWQKKIRTESERNFDLL